LQSVLRGTSLLVARCYDTVASPQQVVVTLREVTAGCGSLGVFIVEAVQTLMAALSRRDYVDVVPCFAQLFRNNGLVCFPSDVICALFTHQQRINNRRPINEYGNG
jgi:hypothetical protein